LQTKEQYHNNGSLQVNKASELIHPTQPLPRKEEQFLEDGAVWTITLHYTIYEGFMGGVGCQRINCPYNWNQESLKEFEEQLRQESIKDIKETLELLEMLTDTTTMTIASAFGKLIEEDDNDNEGGGEE
jgi:hypothetical protein